MTIEFKNLAGGIKRLEASQLIKRPLPEVFDFFSKAENLEILTPPFLRFSIVSPAPIVMKNGTLIDYKIYLRIVPLRWRSEITKWDPPHCFVDKQIKGPYSLWEHTHTFEEQSEGTQVKDIVNYKVLGGTLVERLFVRPDLNKIFRFRQQKLAEIFDSKA